MKCVSHRFAEKELIEAIGHYDEQAPGLGSQFLETFEEALGLIRRHPKGTPVVRGEIRRLVMPRFPYNIVYRLSADSIRILAVAHQKRSPHYWTGRK